MKHNHRPKTDTLSDIHEYKNVTKNRLILSMVVTSSARALDPNLLLAYKKDPFARNNCYKTEPLPVERYSKRVELSTTTTETLII